MSLTHCRIDIIARRNQLKQIRLDIESC